MKFARYLQDTQTPEWKKAYIDYRGLKKRITAIRRWQEGLDPLTSSSADEGDADNEGDAPKPPSNAGKSEGLPTTVPIPQDDNAIAGPSSLAGGADDVSLDEDEDVYQEGLDENKLRRPDLRHKSTSKRALTLPNPAPSQASATTRSTSQRGPNRRRPSIISIRRSEPQPLSLYALLPTLPSVHLAFFSFLDAQLEKIEKFYSDREKEARSRSKALEIQLRELKDHRKIFYEAHPNNNISWAETFKTLPSSLSTSLTLTNIPEAFANISERVSVPAIGKAKDDSGKRDSEATEVDLTAEEGSSNGKGKDRVGSDEDENERIESNKKPEARPSSYPRGLDPEEYQHAKKKLKRAVLEHYRGLEVLNNYRILNITGFRKALKKYEKITKVQAQQAYMKEKVETSAFSSGASVGAMIKETEELFAARFARGDKKKAMARLRAASQHRSHHFSTFRSGIALGLALPAFVSGLYQSYQPERRAAIPSWGALMYIYSAFLIPPLFALLVGVNVLVWSNSRINYIFIFELDVRTRLDHREYFEIPSILLATLAYAFWLSFSHIASPTIWPLVWLALTFMIMFNPVSILFKPSRWWLVKNVSELLISGVHRVEFTDFWMGDQFCSLVFTLSNLYFFVCVYANDFHSDVWQRCGSQSRAGWAAAFVLAMLPLLARLVQSIRRYVDSKLVTHLINGGKYGTGILYYLFYYMWRHQGTTSRGSSFVLMCLFGTIYSIYACTWDFLMDWSFFKPHSKYPLLRPELVYTNEIPLYYFALISNVLIRFIWVLYIPQRGPSIYLKTFIAAILEMLRRWQWNFYRLENEHLGNMDQYRVTREVPLPYSFDDNAGEEEEDADEDGVPRSRWLRRPRTLSTNLKPVSGNSEDKLHVA